MDQLVAKESRLLLRSSGRGKRRPLAVVVVLALTAVAWALAPSSAQAASTFQFAAKVGYPTGKSPDAIATGDLNGDGKPDIVTANNTDDTVSVLLGKGDGTFEPQKTYATGKAPTDVAIADLGNGKRDIVVTNREDSTVSVLLGKGDGTFEPQKTYATGKAPAGVAIADLGNGKLDIVTANRVENTVSVLIGKGDGTFEAPKNYATGETPVAVAIADLNGDKKADIVTANEKESTVSVLLGKGDGTFPPAPTSTIPTGKAPDAVAIGDLNGDQKSDIVAADGGTNQVSVLLGKGDGTFEAQKEYETGKGPAGVALADLNDDGKQDVVTANSEANKVSVLLGKGNGTFTPKLDLETDVKPRALALSDLNGDKKPDIVAANAVDNTASVLLNSSVPALETSASSLSFPNQLFGTRSGAQKVTVTNSGSAPLAISPLTVTGNFAASGCSGSPSPLVLAAGASCQLSVTFSPKGYGSLKGEVTIASNAGAKTIKLSGTGLPPAASVTTGPVSEIVGTYVTLNGTVISQGSGTFYFQYGKSSAYGEATPALPLSSSGRAQLVAATLSLAPGTTYHYRLVASNLAGTSYGGDQVFTIPPEAPTIKLLRHGRLAALLRRGLRVRVSETSPASIQLKLLVNAQTARAAHLIPVHSRRRAMVTVGSARVTVAANRGKTVTVRFGPAARRKLARLGRLRLTLTATPSTLNGVAGEATSLTATVVR
jgi:hypothetical protein